MTHSPSCSQLVNELDLKSLLPSSLFDTYLIYYAFVRFLYYHLLTAHVFKNKWKK